MCIEDILINWEMCCDGGGPCFCLHLLLEYSEQLLSRGVIQITLADQTVTGVGTCQKL